MADYLTGMDALNTGPSTRYPGDWHSKRDWARAKTLDSDRSPFGRWDLYEWDVPVRGRMLVAAAPRACLDLIDHHRFDLAQGMRENYISNEDATPDIFRHAWLLHGRDDWDLINRFMGSEYLSDWLRFLDSKGAEYPHGPRPTFEDYQDGARRPEL